MKIRNLVPRNHISDWKLLAETAANHAASVGVTSVQDMHSDDRRSVYLELEQHGKLKTRVYDCLALLQHLRTAGGRPNADDLDAR